MAASDQLESIEKASLKELQELQLVRLRGPEHLIKAHVGVTTKVRVVAPGSLARSQGKAKRMVDLRPNN